MRNLALLCLVAVASARMYDVIEPFKAFQPPEGVTCLPWDKGQDNMFATGKVPPGIGNACVIPGESVGSCKSIDDCPGAYYGPICPTGKAGSPKFVTCKPPMSTPQQINIQVAASDTVVVGFVTFENELPASPPVAMFGPAGGELKVRKEG